MAELLLAHGTDVNARDNEGDTPLHKTATYGHSNVAEFLLANGAGVNARNKAGKTPLRAAMLWGQPHLAELLRRHGGHEGTLRAAPSIRQLLAELKIWLDTVRRHGGRE